MDKKKPEYLRGNESLTVYTPRVHWLIENEPAMLPKSIEEIELEMSNRLCILALFYEKLVGYVSIIPYKRMKLVKVSSHVVEFNSRENGIGSELSKQIYDLAKELYPEYKVITVVGPENVRKFERLGMIQIDKHDVPKEFIDTASIDLDIDTPDKIIMIEP